MNSNENISNNNLEDSIEKLSKNLYLESPDLWIEFSGKMSDNIFDEMVLFFAIKYNYISIVKHAISNNLLGLDGPSRNSAYPSIREHLISIAKQNNTLDILKYIESPSTFDDTSECISKSEIDEIASSSDDNKNKYFPKYLCSVCNHNVFESGYKVSESIEYKYSPVKNDTVEVSRELSDLVICCNCNNELKDLSLDHLNSLSSIQNCINCGSNLTQVGIIDKSKMLFDNDLGKFSNSSKSYHCSKCDMEITNEQVKFFNL